MHALLQRNNLVMFLLNIDPFRLIKTATMKRTGVLILPIQIDTISTNRFHFPPDHSLIILSN